MRLEWSGLDRTRRMQLGKGKTFARALKLTSGSLGGVAPQERANRRRRIVRFAACTAG